MYPSKRLTMLKKILLVFCNILLLLTLLTCELSAQNLKRGYKLLEKADYVKAMGMFRDAAAENKENPAALFGIALILADDSSSFFDLIEAWKYTVLLKANLEKLTEEEIEFIGEYFYNTETRHIPRPVKKKIEYALETIEAKLIKYVREENNLDIVYQVLEKFPDLRHYDNVLHIRNQLEFRKYEKQHKLEGYLEFIRKFPEAAQMEKAIKYRNKLAFEEACRINTVEAYKNFMANYPEATENNMAIKNLYSVAFQQAKQLNTIKAFDDYIAAYPDALEISDAKIIQKQLLYEYAKKIQTLEAYNEFIRKYPEGQQYIDIFNLKSLDNGMHIISANPLPTNNILWARSFDEEENEERTACLAIDTLNAYFAGGTVFRSDTGSTDAWIIKMNSDGKMVWNKYVGEQFNDEVNLIATNGKNEILGAGYTWMGADSSSRESWLFKLGKDGQRIWSRKLGKMHIKSLQVTRTGTIFLGGYLVDDSLNSKYSVVVLNESGKRLWGRTYTGNGEIVEIAECPDQKMLIVGNRWKAKIDTKGYLIWESPFSNTDSILAAQVLPKGELAYLGLRNNGKLVLIKTNPDNKSVFEKEIALADIPVQINSLIRGGMNQLIALITCKENQFLCWINTSSGELLTSALIPHGIMATGIKPDNKNNQMHIARNSGIVLIKNNGLVF
jgi:tetratricopeptide (TPR) repeat protein